MYIFPIYLTLINFIISIFFGRFIGIKGACYLTSFFIGISFLISLFIYYEVVVSEVPCYIVLSDWFSFDLLNVNWVFYFDVLTATMLLVVTFVSFCAHFYSIEYMNGDPHQVRFMAYLSLFTFFMLMLVTAGNLIQLFVGWEGVGICSYLLINFWYTRLKANKAAIMAVVTNKFGDITLLLAFGLVYYIYKSFDFNVIFAYVTSIIDFQGTYISFISDLNYIVCFLFILGAVGKSAQIGLHIWLPEAMEGPTPVSSLIHAATMVTAGIFLILRCSFVFELVPTVLLWIVFFGSLTTFFASSIGIFQNDLKKIVAYSTCSQLGYMFLACGLSGYNYSMFHLFNHAFFKALLFLTAGYIIHSISNEQDIRKMGGLLKLFPFSYIMILIASLSLMGLPFYSGFYSKEKIVELFNNRYSISLVDVSSYNLYFFFQLISTLAIVCTIIYSMRLLVFVFFTLFNGFYLYLSNITLSFNAYFKRNNGIVFSISSIHYGSYFLMIPLVLLCILTITSGYLFRDVMIGEGIISWNSSLYFSYFDFHLNSISLNSFVLINYEFNEYIRSITFFWVIYFTIVASIIFLFFRLYIYNLKLTNVYSFSIHKTLVEKYIYFNKIFIDSLSFLMFYFSYYVTYLLIDKGLVERIGPFGLYNIIKSVVVRVKYLENYYTTHYVFFILFSYMFVLFFVI
jgi:proton-translocating NADH-quinone oxidoreductase chain L